MLEGAKRIKELYEDDEFKPLLVEGDHGFGKTSYANRLISQVYSKDEKKANWSYEDRTDDNGNIKEYSIFPYHLGFHPTHVLDLWISKKGSIQYRDKVFHWDDAGLWLHSLDFQDPFVKEVGKYMQVVRSDWACVIFSAISRHDISSKIRGMRNAIIVEITKEAHGKNHGPAHYNRRTARAYIERKTWKGKVWKDYQWEDRFDSHVPGVYTTTGHGVVKEQSGFYGWYKPRRDYYNKMAKKHVMKKMAKHDFSKDDIHL